MSAVYANSPLDGVTAFDPFLPLAVGGLRAHFGRRHYKRRSKGLPN